MLKEEIIKILLETDKKMLYKKRETAEKFSVSEATIDRLRRSGELKSKKVLGQIMFTVDEVAQFLSE